MGNISSNWPVRFLDAITALDTQLEQVLDVSSCRECWLQVELLLAMRKFDPTFAINKYCYAGTRRDCKADFYSEQNGGMVAELKLLGNGYMTKCFDGGGRLEHFVPKMAGERITITAEHLEAATGYFLHDCARLQKAKDVAERYMILIVDRREPTDNLGRALLAAKVSEQEWSRESRHYIVRVWLM